MKQFEVRMTMTVCVTVNVEAENQEDAEKKALEKTGNEEAFYLSRYDSVWERNVVEVNECEAEEEEEPNPMKPALDYVCEQLGTERTVAIRMQVTYNMKHRMPVNTGIDDAKVIDLLEEYGQDNDLPEGWWENEGDIEDILLEL